MNTPKRWLYLLALGVFLAGCPDNGDDDSAGDPGWYEMTSGTSATLRGVWAPGDNSAFAVGDDGTILQYDGSAWSATTVEPYPGTNIVVDLEGVWGASGTDMFAVGIAPNDVITEGEIWHLSGGTWAMDQTPIDGGLEAIHGVAGACAFAVGSWYEPDWEEPGGRGYLVMQDSTGGGTFSRAVEENNSSELRGVWAETCSNVFAVGGYEEARILHHVGGDWTVEDLPIGNNLWAVWAASGNDAFAVGDAGKIFRYDGTTWTEMNTGVTANLRGIWGTSADNVYAVGFSGTVLQFDGTSWTILNVGSGADFKAVHGTSETDVFVVGSDGTILRYGVE